jgi:glycosyltransferase involved in cell wall biosynthesis
LVGGRQQADYVARLGMRRDRIFLGYDAVDNEYFARGAEEARRKAEEVRDQRSEVRKQCVALEYRPYFFANCRFIERKNLDGLIRAYAKYRRQVSDPWNLVISGSGEEDARLKDLAQQLGVFADPSSLHRQGFAGQAVVKRLSSVCFPGFLQYSELPTYYGLASAFIHPAMRESWGLVVNEAAAAGSPLIVSNIVGARYELIREEENGLLFDPGNVEELAACLRKMASMTAERREAWGARSREIVGAFGPERFGQGLREAIAASRPIPSKEGS